MPQAKVARGDWLQVHHVASLPSASARRVYDIPEIRRLILRLLPKDGLAKFMRVERNVMSDVARVLYYTTNEGKLKGRFSKNSERQRLYTSSITESSYPRITLTAKMARKLDIPESRSQKQMGLNAQWSRVSQPELFVMLVPPILEKCSRLRRIVFGPAPVPFGSNR